MSRGKTFYLDQQCDYDPSLHGYGTRRRARLSKWKPCIPRAMQPKFEEGADYQMVSGGARH
jgi:hypothetical protein